MESFKLKLSGKSGSNRKIQLEASQRATWNVRKSHGVFPELRLSSRSRERLAVKQKFKCRPNVLEKTNKKMRKKLPFTEGEAFDCRFKQARDQMHNGVL